MIQVSAGHPSNGFAPSAVNPIEAVKVVRLVTRLVGGPSVNVCLLSSLLDRRRYRTWLVCGVPQPGESENADLASKLGLTPVYVDAMRRGVGLRDFEALLRIQQLLAKLRPEIVHTHTAKAGALGRCAALLHGASREFRPCLIHTFEGHSLDGYFSRPVAQTFTTVERFLARFTDVIVAVSPQIRRELVELFRIAPPQKVRVIPVGLDFEWLAELPVKRGWLRQALGARDSSLLIGIIGRLAPIKNQELGLRAFSRFIERTRLDAYLVIFGDGELRERLAGLARDLGVAERVSFQGWQTDRSLIFSDLDITCLCSLNEGTPLVLIESLAAGVPIVSTRVGGVGDVIQDGVDGELVESGNESQLAAALEQVAASRYRLPTERMTSIRDFYSARRLVAQVEDLYEEVLERKRGLTTSKGRR